MIRHLVLAGILLTAPLASAAAQQQGLSLDNILTMADAERRGPVDQYLLGRQAAAELAANSKLLPAGHALTDYLRRVVHTLALGSNAPYVYRGPVVGVLDTPEINAFAAPGGFIMVTTGLIDFLDGEDELASILGHELGHIELEHTLYEMRNAVAGKMWQQATGAKDMDSGMTKWIKQGYSVEIEAEADARGIALAAAAGYDPRALIGVLERFRSRTNSYGGANYPVQRAAMAEKAAAALPAPAAEAVAKRTERFRAVRAQMRAAAPSPAPAPKTSSQKKGKKG